MINDEFRCKNCGTVLDISNSVIFRWFNPATRKIEIKYACQNCKQITAYSSHLNH